MLPFSKSVKRKRHNGKIKMELEKIKIKSAKIMPSIVILLCFFCSLVVITNQRLFSTFPVFLGIYSLKYLSQ